MVPLYMPTTMCVQGTGMSPRELAGPALVAGQQQVADVVHAAQQEVQEQASSAYTSSSSLPLRASMPVGDQAAQHHKV